MIVSTASLQHKGHPRSLAITIGFALFVACCTSGHSQGLINFGNSVATLITLVSNGVSLGPTPATLGGFRYELFVAPAGVVTPASFATTGLIATNIGGAGRLNGGNSLPAHGAPLGAAASILVRGWSANLGPNYATALVAYQAGGGGYLGESTIAPQFQFGGNGGSGGVPISPAFGGSSGIASGFALAYFKGPPISLKGRK